MAVMQLQQKIVSVEKYVTGYMMIKPLLRIEDSAAVAADFYICIQPATFKELETALSRTSLILADFDGVIVPFKGKPEQEYKKIITLIMKGDNNSKISIITGRLDVSPNHVISPRDFASETKVCLSLEMGGLMLLPDGEERILVDKESLDIIHGLGKELDEYLFATFPGTVKEEKMTMLTYQRPDGVTSEKFGDVAVNFVKGLPKGIYEKVEIAMGERNLDIVVKGYNKGKAVDEVVDYINGKAAEGIPGYSHVDVSKVVYLGDGSPDIPAFERVLSGGGVGIAPANADSRVTKFIVKDATNRMILYEKDSSGCALDVLQIVLKDTARAS